jgi:hypothetical protein
MTTASAEHFPACCICPRRWGSPCRRGTRFWAGHAGRPKLWRCAADPRVCDSEHFVGLPGSGRVRHYRPVEVSHGFVLDGSPEIPLARRQPAAVREPMPFPLQAFGSVTVNSGDAQALDGQSVTLGGTKNDYLQLLDPTGDLPNQDFYSMSEAFWGTAPAPWSYLAVPRAGSRAITSTSTGRNGVVFWSSTDGSATTSSTISGAVDLTDGLPTRSRSAARRDAAAVH